MSFQSVILKLGHGGSSHSSNEMLISVTTRMWSDLSSLSSGSMVHLVIYPIIHEEMKALSGLVCLLVASACSVGISLGSAICRSNSAITSIKTWDFSRFPLMNRWLL